MEVKNYFAQDSQGNAQPNATCYLYAVGTETLVTGLTNITGQAITNPFHSDSFGLIQFKAPNGIYDLRVVSGVRDYRIRVQCNDLNEAIETTNTNAALAVAAAQEAAESAIKANTINLQFPFNFVAGKSQYDVSVISGRSDINTTSLALIVEGTIVSDFTITTDKIFTLNSTTMNALADGAQMWIIVNSRFDDLISNFDELQDGFTAEFQSEKVARTLDYYNHLKNLQLEPSVAYTTGLSIVRPTQTVTQSGVLYRPLATALPITTTTWATDASKFVVANDMSLRDELMNTSDVNKGIATVGRASVTVSSILDILTTKRDVSQSYIVRGYIPGTSIGGGQFYWDATRSKTLHDGRNIISPTVPWVGTTATLPSFLAGVGETSVGGIGCFVRVRTSNEVEVESYGGITADTINKSIQKLDTGSSIFTGGQIAVPTGQWPISTKVLVNNPSASTTFIQGVTIKGRGKQATTLDFASQPAGQNGIEMVTPIFAGIEDMGVRNSKAVGIKLVGQPTIPGAASWNHINIDRVRSSFNTTYGLELDRGFMGHFNQVFTTHNGGDGIKANGLHTSLHFNNCYAASNLGGSGYRLNELTYSVMTACASDGNSQHGYSVTKTSTLVMNGCGSESNQRSGLSVTSSTALGKNYAILVQGMLAFDNNKSNTGYPNLIHVKASDGVGSKVIARACRSQAPAFATVDILVDGIGAELVDEDNECPNGVQSANGGYIHYVHRAKVIRSLSVTAATAVVELMSPQGHQGSYGGEILIQASIADPSSTAVRNSATYKLLIDKGVSALVMEIAKVGMTTGGGTSFPSFTWSLVGNMLTATPVGSTSGAFYFEVLTSGFVKTK